MGELSGVRYMHSLWSHYLRHFVRIGLVDELGDSRVIGLMLNDGYAGLTTGTCYYCSLHCNSGSSVMWC